MATQEQPLTDYLRTYGMTDPIELIYFWRNEGITPLTVVKGYAELFLDGTLGTLTSEQHDAMKAIDHCCREAIVKWQDFGDYFHLGQPDEQVLSPTEVDEEGRLYLHEQIFEKAPISLHTVKEFSELLLREKLGTLTDEQQKVIEIINRWCVVAIERWRQPIAFFSKPERA